MKKILVLSALLAFCLPLMIPASTLAADLDPSTRVALALARSSTKAISATKTTCNCGPYCDCGGGRFCGDPACRQGARTILDAAADRAEEEDRPLLVWVGMVCPPCEAKMRGYIHCKIDSYKGDSTPRVMVCQPVDDGIVVRETFTTIPTVAQVRSALRQSHVVAPPRAVTPVVMAPPIVPVMRPMMPMMMGGFGGGCAGGRCGGGCCR